MVEICIPFLSDCGWGKHPGLLVLTEQNIFLFFNGCWTWQLCTAKTILFFLFFYYFLWKKVQAPEGHSDGAKDFGINMQGE